MLLSKWWIAAPVAFGLLAVPVGAAPGGRSAEAQTASPVTGAPLDEDEADTDGPQDGGLTAVWAAGRKVATPGPATVRLLDQAAFAVPEGMVFIPQPQATEILRANGNIVGTPPVGLVAPVDEDKDWFIEISFNNGGFVNDKSEIFSNDALLNKFINDTESDNKERLRRGGSQYHVVGWIDEPNYDAANHRLVWSFLAKREGADGRRIINYVAYLLGRDGYFKLYLITSPDQFEVDKPAAKAVFSNITYLPGKRYEDFDGATDRIAAYGLATLVGAVAAKKLGLFAGALAFMAKFAKVGILAVAGVGAVLAKLFSRTR